VGVSEYSAVSSALMTGNVPARSVTCIRKAYLAWAFWNDSGESVSKPNYSHAKAHLGGRVRHPACGSGA